MSTVTFVATSDTLVLTNLELGNIERIKNGQTEQSNISGEVSILKQSYWPSVEHLVFRFTKLCPADVLAIIEFLGATVGEAVTLTDHLSVSWSGCITTPQAELSRGHSDTVTIEFEGIKT